MDGPEILVRILAQTDALWLPCRTWSGDLPAVLGERRADYRRHGIAWHSGSAGSTEKKDVQRIRDRLVAEGHLVQFRRRESRTTSVRLTSDADYRIRHLVGLPGRGEAMALMAKIRRYLRDHPEAEACPEIRLTCGRGWGDDCLDYLLDVESRLLPALVRGRVESETSTQGHCHYRLTGKGPLPPEPTATPSYDSAMAELYLDVFERSLLSLRSAKAEGRDIGLVPCPVSYEF